MLATGLIRKKAASTKRKAKSYAGLIAIAELSSDLNIAQLSPLKTEINTRVVPSSGDDAARVFCADRVIEHYGGVGFVSLALSLVLSLAIAWVRSNT